MGTYAAKTDVSSDRSRAEIEKILARYGADKFMYGWDGPRAVVSFSMNGRMIRFNLTLPDREEFNSTPTGKKRVASAAEKAYEQAVRQKWRALCLVVKAKLEAVESGITTFEEEFLAQTVLPDNTSVGQFILPQVAEAYQSGKMPSMLALEAGKKS